MASKVWLDGVGMALQCLETRDGTPIVSAGALAAWVDAQRANDPNADEWWVDVEVRDGVTWVAIFGEDDIVDAWPATMTYGDTTWFALTGWNWSEEDEN